MTKIIDITPCEELIGAWECADPAAAGAVQLPDGSWQRMTTVSCSDWACAKCTDVRDYIGRR